MVTQMTKNNQLPGEAHQDYVAPRIVTVLMVTSSICASSNDLYLDKLPEEEELW